MKMPAAGKLQLQPVCHLAPPPRAMHVKGALWLVLVLVVAAAAKTRSPSDWAKFSEEDWDRVDEDWVEGDEPEDLLTEEQIKFQEFDKARKDPVAAMDAGAKNPIEGATHAKAMGGPTMIFATLKPWRPAVSKPWDTESTKELAMQWTDLLFTGGVTVSCYDIEVGKILVTLQKGWDGFQLKDFLLAQNEVMSVLWDQVTYTADGEVEKGPKPRPKTKKVKRKKRKKKAGKAKKAKKAEGKGAEL